ncbi:hypothetical protein G6F35_019170 [Rhizopus arrhizus]|nr:hypothetical protein G6F35_019170 [Rhizopus arrhizus]
MMMAPTEIMCRSMFRIFMIAIVPSTVVGTMALTIRPVLIPRNSTTTAMTMTRVSRKTLATRSSWVETTSA